MEATVVSFLTAIPERVSPLFTVYSTIFVAALDDMVTIDNIAISL